MRPAHGLVAAGRRHSEARSGMPLLHDRLLLSVKAQRLDGTWGSVHTRARGPSPSDPGRTRPDPAQPWMAPDPDHGQLWSVRSGLHRGDRERLGHGPQRTPAPGPAHP
ncbi:hypothetical protein ACFVRD_38560 [Streptomyces sp. NPDC057908]|uniref:hypothetical protein n=1 Tax=Streptomyces sp. NPDC057908 TaxID=3346276 RepID=UPI0036E3B0F5